MNGVGDEYVDVGPARVKALTDNGAFIATDCWESWIPFSVIDVEDLARCENGARLETIGVKRWFLEQREGIE